MKYTLIITLVILASCSSERKCRMAINKAEKLGCLKLSDSVRVDSFERIVRERDTTKVVEIVREYIKDSSKADSNDIITIRKYRFKGFVGTLIIDWGKHTYDLNGVVLSENKKETTKSVDSVAKEKKTTDKKTIEEKHDCPKQKWWDNFWFGVIFGWFSVAIIGYILLKIIHIKNKL